MSFLFVGATGDRAGHGLVTWALAESLSERGFKVGFIKPFGTHPIRFQGAWTDRDALLMKEVLNLQEPFDRICPFPTAQEGSRETGAEQISAKIKSLAQETSKGKDILLVMGSRHVFFDDASYGVSDISLNTELDANFVLVTRFRKISTSMYSILSVKSMLEDRMNGVIINRVPPEKLKDIRNQMIPTLAQKGVQITVAIPEDPFLSFRSLEEIRNILDAEVIWGEEKLQEPAGGMTVGASELNGDLLLFKRVYNKIILLAPASRDLENEETAASRSIAAIVLTGGRKPAPKVLEVAKKARIPVMLVGVDTFAARERLEKAGAALSTKHKDKVRRFTELMNRDGSLDRLIESLGVGAV
jgi:BioD-like phosphotransacetylase family protein